MPEQPALPGVALECFEVPSKSVVRTDDGWNPKLHYHLVQSDDALAQMVSTLNAHEADGFAWDTETSGLKPELGARICGHCIAVRTGEKRMDGYYIPVRHIGPSNAYEPQLDPEHVASVLAPLFEDASRPGEIATYHKKFDAKMLRADGVRIRRAAVDIAIEATAANENEPRFGLKQLAEKYCSPAAKGEQETLDKWMRKDARQLGLSYKKHSKKKRKQLGLNALTTPTYLDRFGYSRAPIALAATYGIHDAFFTWWLSRVKYADVRNQFRDLWEREHAVGEMLGDMEWRGLPVDEEAIRDTHERTMAAVKYWLAEAREASGGLLDDSFEASDSDLRQLFYNDLKFTPPKFTQKDNKPSTDREARQLLRRAYPQWERLFTALDNLAGDPDKPGLLKLHSTYAGNYLRYYSPVTETVNPSYNQLERKAMGGAPVTGRLSSSDPNNQNVSSKTIHLWDCHCDECLEASAKEAAKLGRIADKTVEARAALELRGQLTENTVSIRRYFTVPDGHVRAYIDFSQIELRILAWFCQDPNLLRAYHNGLDVHQMVADQLRIARKIAKQVNFGNSYGMTEIGLALRIPGYYDDPEGTREYAKEVLRAYFQQYPNILTFRRDFARKMRRRGNMFINPFGRPRRIHDISASGEDKWKRKRAERMMMSSIISGTSADLMKESMRRTWPIVTSPEVGGAMVQTIHDELVFDLPMKKGWSNTLVQLKRTMEDWPFFSEDRFYDGQFHRGLPIEASVELSTTTWEDKRALEFHADGTFSWAE